MRSPLPLLCLIVPNVPLASFRTRLASLFWIAVSNFLFPVLFSLIQIMFLFRDDGYITGTSIYLVNSYVEIIGVLFATVWVAGTHWTIHDSKNPDPSIASNGRYPQIRRGTGQNRSEGAGTFRLTPTSRDVDTADNIDFALNSQLEDKKAIHGVV